MNNTRKIAILQEAPLTHAPHVSCHPTFLLVVHSLPQACTPTSSAQCILNDFIPGFLLQCASTLFIEMSEQSGRHPKRPGALSARNWHRLGENRSPSCSLKPGWRPAEQQITAAFRVEFQLTNGLKAYVRAGQSRISPVCPAKKAAQMPLYVVRSGTGTHRLRSSAVHSVGNVQRAHLC